MLLAITTQEKLISAPNMLLIFISALLLSVGAVYSVKQFVFVAQSGFTTRSINSLKNKEFETEERKWLRQQPQDFYAAFYYVPVK
jgi:hypothetical protein